MEGRAGTIHDSKNQESIQNPIFEWFWNEILIHWLDFRFKSIQMIHFIDDSQKLVNRTGLRVNSWLICKSNKMRRDKMPCRVFLCEPARRFATSSARWSLRTSALTGLRCPNFKSYFVWERSGPDSGAKIFGFKNFFRNGFRKRGPFQY